MVIFSGILSDWTWEKLSKVQSQNMRYFKGVLDVVIELMVVVYATQGMQDLYRPWVG